jgi:hypothetical protein
MRSVPYAYYLLPHSELDYANKANPTVILPFQLNRVKTYEKSEKSKKAIIDTFKRTSKKYETTSLSSYNAHTLAKIK